MSRVLQVAWNMRAEVNDQLFSVAGHGEADLNSGSTRLELTVAPELPQGFDPALTQRICNFALAGYAAPGPEKGTSLRDAVSDTLFIRPARVARVYDDAGEEIVKLEALTTLEVTGEKITVNNWMTGFSHLPGPIEFIRGNEDLMSQEAGAAVGVCRFKAGVAGRELSGLTVVPYCFDRDVVVAPLRRTITEESVSWLSSEVVVLSAVSHWTVQPTHSAVQA